MKKSIFYLAMLMGALFMASCSDDDDGMVDATPDATCDDGIMNGDETGVDCGGSICNQ